MGIKALIVDDNKAYARMVELSLQSFVDCEYVEDGHQAFKLYCTALKSTEPYQLIVSDLMMPKDTGVKLVRQIREMEKKLSREGDQKMFLIVVTGFEDDMYVEKVLDAGANHCLYKSGGTAPIIASIKQHFKIKD